MYGHLEPAVDRFKALDEEKQDEFRVALGAYVRLYAFLSQILPFTDPDLEKLYTFGRFLELRLPRPEEDPLEARCRDGARLLPARHRPRRAPSAQGRRGGARLRPDRGRDEAVGSEEVKLSEIIEILNERFGTDFKKADQLVFDSVAEELKADEAVQQHASVNPSTTSRSR